MMLTRPEKLIVLTIDIGLIVYWALIIARVLPPELLFDGYDRPEVQAWNWSFLPLDILAAVTGIIGTTTSRFNPTVLLTVSLVLTSTAGGMAIGYWALSGFVDLYWWAPNLVLLLFPLRPLARFLRHTVPGQQP